MGSCVMRGAFHGAFPPNLAPLEPRSVFIQQLAVAVSFLSEHPCTLHPTNTKARFRKATIQRRLQGPSTVVLRYDSCYAALIASGSWKAHEHKALAKEARKAWDDLLASKGDERLWLRHVKGHSRHTHNNTADSLACKRRASGADEDGRGRMRGSAHTAPS